MSEEQAIPSNLTERLIRLEVAQENRAETQQQILEMLNMGLSTVLGHVFPEFPPSQEEEIVHKSRMTDAGVHPSKPPVRSIPELRRLHSVSAVISGTDTAELEGRVVVVLQGRPGFKPTGLIFQGSSLDLRITRVSLHGTVLVENEQGVLPTLIHRHLLRPEFQTVWHSGDLVVEGILPNPGDRMDVSVTGVQDVLEESTSRPEPVRGRRSRKTKKELPGRFMIFGEGAKLTKAGPFTLRFCLQQSLVMEGWVLVSPCEGFVEHLSFGEHTVEMAEPMPLGMFKSKLVSSNWRGTELPSGVDIVVKGTLKAPGNVDINVWGRVPDQPIPFRTPKPNPEWIPAVLEDTLQGEAGKYQLRLRTQHWFAPEALSLSADGKNSRVTFLGFGADAILKSLNGFDAKEALGSLDLSDHIIPPGLDIVVRGIQDGAGSVSVRVEGKKPPTKWKHRQL